MPDRDGVYRLSKAVRRVLWSKHGGDFCPRAREWSESEIREWLPDLIPNLTEGGRLFDLADRSGRLVARVGYGHLMTPAYLDGHGFGLLDPPDRKAYPVECQHCVELPICESADGSELSDPLVTDEIPA